MYKEDGKLNSFLKGNQIDFDAVERETSIDFVEYMKNELLYEIEKGTPVNDIFIESNKVTKYILVLTEIGIHWFTFYLDDGLYRVESLGAWVAKLFIDRGTLKGYHNEEDRRIV